MGLPEAGDEALSQMCKDQLAGWFGKEVHAWRFLKSYRIKHSQPGQTPPNGAVFEKDPRVSEGIYCCGDHVNTATLNGAMDSGKRAATAVLEKYGEA